MGLRQWFGSNLARYLSEPGRTASIGVPTDIGNLASTLKPGDVILVEGTSRVSTAIKYLTQSTWSHAALYVGKRSDLGEGNEEACVIEADINDGVRAVSLATFDNLHCRICRPVSLSVAEIDAVCLYAVRQLGHTYDLKNIFDLARYLLPTPPVPTRWRRKMLAMGSGDPTRAICSTLIAQAFQAVRYPILPIVEILSLNDPNCRDCVREVMHVRHHSLFAPRDFDVSPYFSVVKPTLAQGFDHRSLQWGAPATEHLMEKPNNLDTARSSA